MAVMDLLRSVIEELAPIPRLPTSDGERDAAISSGTGWRATGVALRWRRSARTVLRLADRSAERARIRLGRRELERTPRAGRDRWGSRGNAGIVDDITGGAMATRRVAMRPRTAYNVVAETGDPESARTLVVLAHHDAAPSGLVFDQTVTQWLADRRPDIVEALKSNPPLWWPVIAGPAFVSLGSVAGSRRLRWLVLISSLVR
jgi:hypothetical protein